MDGRKDRKEMRRMHDEGAETVSETTATDKKKRSQVGHEAAMFEFHCVAFPQYGFAKKDSFFSCKIVSNWIFEGDKSRWSSYRPGTQDTRVMLAA